MNGTHKPRKEKTAEQEAVIAHPIGSHARVLAVAGSGKTTTMVLRVKELVQNRGVNPDSILVVMFNKLARREFQEKLNRFRIPEDLQPEVHTFHSFCFKLINSMISQGVLPRNPDLWTGDREEKYRWHVLRAIEYLQQRGEIPGPAGAPGSLETAHRDGALPPFVSIDPGEAIEAIGLWKGSLIPPSRAGYRGDPSMPLIYAEFERLRNRANALTFDDYVPLAVDLLENNAAAQRAWTGRYAHVIVDEYQDINFGQQRLVELLAGSRADVMVVGDDDQTIYEWRGARPKYMIREFGTIFSNKPQTEYKLSNSFRFGPVIAQCAYNTIGRNTDRVPKPLVAFDMTKQTALQVIIDSSEQQSDVSKALTNEVERLIKHENTAPKDIIVLARMFVQLSGLETEFLSRGIPYRIEGQKPFFERRELRTLLDYIRLARVLDRVPSKRVDEWLLNVANTPNRKLSRDALSKAVRVAQTRKWTTVQALTELIESPETRLSASQREKLADLISMLERLYERLDEPTLRAGALLRWLVDTVEYYQHFDNYYGSSEESVDRKTAVDQFIQYANRLDLSPLAFLEHVDALDPTQGEPEDQQICMTTIFRTKGLEYDYVLIPQCEEGYMPALHGISCPIYDTEGIVQEPELSEAIEGERRLFYVALTRGKKCVYIGASTRPSKGVMSYPSVPSRFLEEILSDSVVGVMTPFQRLALEDHTQASSLVEALREHGGQSWVRTQFIGDYLARLGDEALTGKAVGLLASLPELPFGYTHAYPVPERKTSTSPSHLSATCASCGALLAPNANYCGNCGRPRQSSHLTDDDLPF